MRLTGPFTWDAVVGTISASRPSPATQAADALKRSYGERDIDLDTAHVFVQTRDAPARR